MATIKFSQFVDGGELIVGSKVVGLSSTLPYQNTIFDFPGTGIKDASSNYLLQWTSPGGAAVNHVQVTNAITGNPAVVGVAGSDANISLSLQAKGTNGSILLNPGLNGTCVITSSTALALPNGTTIERPGSPTNGMIRFNSSLSALEYYSAGWNPIGGGTGTVTSVLAGAGINVINGTTNPTVSIDSNYFGQTSITTLGTIILGTWNASVINSTYGGTGVNNGGRTLTMTGGNIAFTTAGNVSLTLPASGTLASSAVNNAYNFNVQSQMQIKDYSETLDALGNVNGATVLDLANGNVFSATVTGATTFSTANVPVTGSCASISLFLRNGGSAAVTWMTTTQWPGGVAPTLTVAGLDVLVFCTLDGGTTWYGNVAGQSYS